MVEITKETIETFYKSRRVGMLGTTDELGQHNIIYFGNPQLSKDQ